MKKIAIFLLVGMMVLASGACTRSKAAKTVITPTLPAVAPFPVVTKATAAVNELSITQTALSSAFTNPTATPITIATLTAVPMGTVVGTLAAPVVPAAPGGVIASTPLPTSALPETSPTPAGTAATPPFEVFSGNNSGYPTFGVRGVVQDTNVTLQLNDFPPDVHYIVKMGPIDTAAVNGTVVYEGESGTGGSATREFTIPAALKGQGTIAVRIEFSSGTWAANYFYNITTR